MGSDIISTSRKAHIINEDSRIYGTFAEIGAGQEVARHFFQAGHASNTVAKSMSAYDMTFSDEIYGKASRYVSEDRLKKMLDHEFTLLTDRLAGSDRCFFAFANTVMTSSHQENSTSHAWMGLRFQMRPGGPANEIVLHVKMLDRLRLQQQEVLGVLGVNLMYAAWYLADDEKMFISSLLDNLTADRVHIDYIGCNGPDLNTLNVKKLGLELLTQKMTPALIYNSDGEVLQATDYLYGQPVVVLRGTFRPVTNTNLEILNRALKESKQISKGGGGKDPIALLELTVQDSDDPDAIDHEDYLNRIEMINACGYPVLVSYFPLFYQLKAFLRRCTANDIFIVVGAPLLEKLFDEKYYSHLQGGLLKASGKLFDEHTKLLVYPYKTKDICLNAQTFNPLSKCANLYRYLKDNAMIVDMLGCDDVDTSLQSTDVRKMLKNKDTKWREYVPQQIHQLVEKKLK